MYAPSSLSCCRAVDVHWNTEHFLFSEPAKKENTQKRKKNTVVSVYVDYVDGEIT